MNKLSSYLKIGVIGNRVGWTYNDIKQVLDKHIVGYKYILISGGAKGVDSFAQQYAKEKGLEFRIFYPCSKTPSPQRYFERNMKIVNSSDIIIAFDKQTYSGSLNTINTAKKQNKKVMIIK